VLLDDARVEGREGAALYRRAGDHRRPPMEEVAPALARMEALHHDGAALAGYIGL
jgi:hypothetical protein